MSTTRHTNPYDPIVTYPDEYLERVIEYPGPDGKEQQSQAGRTPENFVVEEPEKTLKSKRQLLSSAMLGKSRRAISFSHNIPRKENNIL